MTEAQQDDTQHIMDLDLADEEQIVQEMSGRASEKYIYELKQKGEDGQPVMGLSYSGTNWACRELAQQGEVIRVIKQEDVSDELDAEFIKIAVTTQRFKIDKETGRETALDSHIAGKRQPKNMTKNIWENGVQKGMQSVPDPFAWEKCLSKAVRNAKQALMPSDMVRKLIAKVKAESGKSKIQGKPAGKGVEPQGHAAPGAAKPAGAPASAPAAAAPASASAATAPAAAPAPAPAAAAPAADSKPKMSKDVMVQKLDAVSKMAFGTQDGAAARQMLAKLTGKASPSDLSEEELKKLGNAINAVAKKTAEVVGNDVVKTADKSVLWKGPAVAAPAPAAAPAAAAESEEMF